MVLCFDRDSKNFIDYTKYRKQFKQLEGYFKLWPAASVSWPVCWSVPKMSKDLVCHDMVHNREMTFDTIIQQISSTKWRYNPRSKCKTLKAITPIDTKLGIHFHQSLVYNFASRATLVRHVGFSAISNLINYCKTWYCILHPISTWFYTQLACNNPFTPMHYTWYVLYVPPSHCLHSTRYVIGSHTQYVKQASRSGCVDK